MFRCAIWCYIVCLLLFIWYMLYFHLLGNAVLYFLFVDVVCYFVVLFYGVICYRARNNGRSTDNVRNDCWFDRSNFRLASHVEQSKFNRIENERNLRFLLFSFFSCYLWSRCVLWNFDMKSWWHATRAVVYNSRIETDIMICLLPITLSNDSWEINL